MKAEPIISSWSRMRTAKLLFRRSTELVEISSASKSALKIYPVIDNENICKSVNNTIITVCTIERLH
jgi:hypothetical protein